MSNSSITGVLRKYSRYIYYALLIVYLMVSKRARAADDEVFGSELKPPGRYEVAKFNFDHVSDVYAITLWILLGSLAKVGQYYKDLSNTLHIYCFSYSLFLRVFRYFSILLSCIE